MTEITRCPECGTRFKVTAAQLDAHDGLVRCGHCQNVFNAREHLHDDEPSPQLSLPIDTDVPLLEAELAPDLPVPPEKPATLAQQVRFVEELTEEVAQLQPRKADRAGIALVTLLALTLLAQAGYHFRVELAARLPGIKPLLLQYCELLACTVPLPQKVELMAIESSDLQSDPGQGNIVTLQALIHNRAPYAQAYPSLELTLTDMQDRDLARRVLHPADYLKAGADQNLGVAPRRDLDVKVRIDTTDLKPSGYRLFLFYPD